MDSMKFSNVFIKDSFSVAGPLESQGQIKTYPLVMDDYYYHEKTFEQAEVKMQRVVMDNLLLRNKLLESDIDYLILDENCFVFWLGYGHCCSSCLEQCISLTV